MIPMLIIIAMLISFCHKPKIAKNKQYSFLKMNVAPQSGLKTHEHGNYQACKPLRSIPNAVIPVLVDLHTIVLHSFFFIFSFFLPSFFALRSIHSTSSFNVSNELLQANCDFFAVAIASS